MGTHLFGSPCISCTSSQCVDEWSVMF